MLTIEEMSKILGMKAQTDQIIEDAKAAVRESTALVRLVQKEDLESVKAIEGEVVTDDDNEYEGDPGELEIGVLLSTLDTVRDVISSVKIRDHRISTEDIEKLAELEADVDAVLEEWETRFGEWDEV